MATRSGHRLNRRRFLGAMGASVGAAALNPGGAIASPGRPQAGHHGHGFLAPEHFGRIFRLGQRSRGPVASIPTSVTPASRDSLRPGRARRT